MVPKPPFASVSSLLANPITVSLYNIAVFSVWYKKLYRYSLKNCQSNAETKPIPLALALHQIRTVSVLIRGGKVVQLG
jgi:hypothetical protein